ncbi:MULTISPECIES: hypothetical protein [unclassified Massilia]|uniref:hypothetical protein n=1 Tax=unclassified Massilia TaxID=2609279 RepID=UPI000A6A3E71|nr:MULTISPECIES: hypothetical protein [unclassified Massilia]
MNTSASQPVTMTELLSAFFVHGMHDHDVGLVLAKWDNGHAELVHDMLTYAAPLAQMMTAAILCVGDNVAGVFLYEVAEPFGNWFADVVINTRDVPERARAIAKLQDLVIEFYSSAENADPLKLAAAVGSADALHVVH